MVTVTIEGWAAIYVTVATCLFAAGATSWGYLHTDRREMRLSAGAATWLFTAFGLFTLFTTVGHLNGWVVTAIVVGAASLWLAWLTHHAPPLLPSTKVPW